jgi:cobalt/nickel transport system permease protein
VHHLVLDEWSRKDSWIHARDPRAKLVAALAMVVAIGTSPGTPALRFGGYALLLGATAAAAGLPVAGTLLRACVVLPFSAVFGAMAWAAGQPERALAVLLKSFLSAWAMVLLTATTSPSAVLRAMESFRVPRFLLLVTHILYRYLFVISEQAQHMRFAAASRGGAGFRLRRGGWRGAAGAIATLFARSHARAEAVHRAMLARGFRGDFVLLSPLRFRAADALFSAWAVTTAAALRML